MSGGLALIPPIMSGMTFRVGNYIDYNTFRAASAASGSALSTNTIYTSLMDIPPGGLRVDRIAIEVTATGTATLARIALYRMGTDGNPGVALFTGATELDVTGTGRKEETVSLSLPQGPIVAAVLLNGSCTLMAYGTPTSSPLGYADTLTTTKVVSWTQSLVYTTMPATFAATGVLASGGPRIGLRVAA